MLLETQSKLDGIARENRVHAQELAALREDVLSLNKSLPVVQLAWEKYKDDYRSFVRSKAVGEQMDELVCRSGTAYKNVEIREVTPVGVQIRHADGQKRIPFEDLADQWHERFQFDPLQKEKAVALEQAMRNQHEAAVVAAEEIRGKEQAEAQEQQKIERRERAEAAIASKELQIRELTKEIRALSNKSSSAAAEAARAKAADARRWATREITGRRFKRNRERSAPCKARSLH